MYVLHRGHKSFRKALVGHGTKRLESNALNNIYEYKPYTPLSIESFENYNKKLRVLGAVGLILFSRFLRRITAKYFCEFFFISFTSSKDSVYLQNLISMTYPDIEL